MSPGRRGGRTFSVLVQLALTLLVTWFIVRAVGLDLAALGDFELSRWAWRPLPLVGSVLLLGAGYVMSGLLWRRMVVEMGGPRVSRAEAVKLFMVTNLARYVPGKVLQVAGLAILARRRGIPPSIATSAAVLGHAFALAGATLVGLGAFFGDHTAWRGVGWAGLGVMAVLIILTSIPGPARTLSGIWMRIAGRLGGDSGMSESAPGPSEARTGTRRPEREDPPAVDHPSPPIPRIGEAAFGLRWTALYLANWGVYATAFWLLFLGVEEWATFLDVAPAFAAAYVIGYLAVFAPAGGGVREGVLVALLIPHTAGPGAALALALLARVWTTVVEIVPAAWMTPGVLRWNSGSEAGTT